MKHTEGFFRDWGYELAKKEFGEYCITEQEVIEAGGDAPRGRLLVRDRQPDHFFHELLTRPEELDIVATTNLNGALIQSLALAAVGGAGVTPNAFVGAKAAVFEAVRAPGNGHGDQNPVSALLAGVMLFDHLGWKDSAELVTHALIKTISDGKGTGDLARHLDGVQIVPARSFCEAIIENFEEVRKSRVRQAMKRTPSSPSLPAI